MSQHRRRHYHYVRKRSGPQVSYWLLLLGLAVIAGLTILTLMWPGTGARDAVRSAWHGALSSRAKSVTAATPSRVFPYSIVAGGIHSKQQFEDAMRSDPVAAAHYANFNAANFRLIKLKREREAYVSFRVGDNVYWTSHKVRLRRGETLISDGRHLGRARCGNRVSETPRLPTYDHEPSAQELNTADEPQVETEAFTANAPLAPSPLGLPVTAPLLARPLTPGSAPRLLASSSPPGVVPFTGIPPYFVPPDGCPHGTVELHGKCSPDTPTTPVAPTPENATLILFLTGVGALTVWGWIRKHRALRVSGVRP